MNIRMIMESWRKRGEITYYEEVCTGRSTSKTAHPPKGERMSYSYVSQTAEFLRNYYRELRGVHTTTMNGGVGKYLVEIYIRNVLATTEPTRLRTAAAVYMNTCRCSWWFGRWSASPSRSFSWVRGITDECMLEATFLA